jgi:hypothetical protein
MTLPVHFTKPALRDLARAYMWYEAQRPGLGGELVQVLEDQLAYISEHPNHFPVVVEDARRGASEAIPLFGALPRRGA